MGEDIVVALRQVRSHYACELFRGTPEGAATRLTGDNAPASTQVLLNNPSQYNLPAVQHIKHGIDGHLYQVLQQGVLRVKDFS